MPKLAEKPLGVGKMDNYQLTENVDWIGNSSISSVTVTCDGCDVGPTAHVGPIMQVRLTGRVTGIHEVHWSYKLLDGRDRCYTTYVKVKDC